MCSQQKKTKLSQKVASVLNKTKKMKIALRSQVFSTEERKGLYRCFQQKTLFQ